MDESKLSRRVVFVTGTRADFGKLKPLIEAAETVAGVETFIFVTGMHMFERYGFTWMEVVKAGLNNIHPFVNQSHTDSMATVLGKTVVGFSDYLEEVSPDLVVVHGDRVEALACASASILSSVLVGHVEGGELSGTVDEALRHSISKLSHLHFVANQEARSLLLQLGEQTESIHVIGSPEVDVIQKDNLPSWQVVSNHYGLPFSEFGIVLFHPVTTETDQLSFQASNLVEAVVRSGQPHVVIYPNNDSGSDQILQAYQDLQDLPQVRMLPSMRFEYYLRTLQRARYIVGNSSSGIREAPYFGTPTINVGTRQDGRLRSPSVIDVEPEAEAILRAMKVEIQVPKPATSLFGHGGTAAMFRRLLASPELWRTPIQKRTSILT